MIVRTTYCVRKLIIALMVIVCSACRKTPDNRIVIPSDYFANSVAIVFNDASGAVIEQVDEGYIFLIPPNGVLNVANEFLD